MSMAEYKQARKKLVIANVLLEGGLVLFWLCFMILISLPCLGVDDPACVWAHDFYNSFPSIGMILFIVIIVATFFILITWLFISACLKFGMRSLHKKYCISSGK